MDNELKNIAVILPSLDPNEKFTRTLQSFLDIGFSDIIVVNDGSKEENLHYFEEAALHPEVTVLTHEVNRGKGAALKTAFQYYLETRPDGIGAVTADGDGQHLASDVRACALRMKETGKVILGCRNFLLPDVPKRNRAGNRLTSFVFRVICGMKLSDTQTGLRAIPSDAMKVFLTTKGDRFEYETRMLLDIKDEKIPFEELTITTVYEEDSNKGSHFRVVRDSVKIYWVILSHIIMYSMSSLVSWLFEQAVDIWLPNFLPDLAIHVGKGASDVLIANGIQFIPGAILSSILNLLINRKVVFRDRKSDKGYILRYYVLWACQLGVRFALLYIIRAATEVAGSKGVYFYQLCSALIQVILFIVGYRIQRQWVFKDNKSSAK